MPNLNKVMLIGSLTRDPEIKYTPKGTAIAQLGLAVNREWRNDAGEKQSETTFVDVELYGRTAEIAGEYLKKGRPVFVEGRLKLDSWDDKQSGQKRSKMKVVGETLQFLGAKPAGDEGDDQDDQSAPPPRSQPRQQARTQSRPPSRPVTPPPRPPVDPDLDSAEDDIPF